MELIRFFGVAVLGLGIDLGVTWWLAQLMGVPVWLAATVGFGCGAALNYILHELWTFKAGARKLSLSRAMGYGVVLGLTLGTRLVVIAIMNPFFPDALLLVLVVAAGISFGVNYIASRSLVFKAQPDQKAPYDTD